MKRGKLYGLGVGPGDPDLITIKAVQVLKQADVIIAPKATKDMESTALSIVSNYIKGQAKILQLVFPMVKKNAELNRSWADNKEIILSYLEKGNTVVFLTLGDPMLYSTFIYVYKLLKNEDYPIECVPGITSFCAASSRLKRPLAEGNDILTVIPGTIDTTQMDELLAISDNVVLMKVNKSLEVLISQLEKHGFSKDSVLITKCGFSDEMIEYDIAKLSDTKISYFSTILARKK